MRELNDLEENAARITELIEKRQHTEIRISNDSLTPLDLYKRQSGIFSDLNKNLAQVDLELLEITSSISRSEKLINDLSLRLAPNSDEQT